MGAGKSAVLKDKRFCSQQAKIGPVGATSFEELQAYGLGYLKSAAQAECYRVFDKMVERASREMKRGLWPE
jgi:hypothetical protein